jgi:serine/threonine protein kinase
MFPTVTTGPEPGHWRGIGLRDPGHGGEPTNEVFMTDTRACRGCGAELAPDAGGDLCPPCLALHGESTVGPEHGTPVPLGPFTAPDPAELGRLFPQLEILELLGRGGMGAVYKARQPLLDRFVAVKILPPESGKTPAFAERFAREAKALARLNHPNIVAVYDSGNVDGLYYFIMEFVDGVNLRQMIRSKQLTPQDALKLVPQICDALQYAHDEGVVHRDIKPENVLVDKKGRVKIADFGLVKLLGSARTDLSLTGPWQVMGTLHYMAPEQMERPKDVDHRADIYALGVMFYEMLTGELPLGRFDPPSQRARVDSRLDEVVLKTLAREPDRRYQSVSEIKTAVERITRTPPEVLPAAATTPTAPQAAFAATQTYVTPPPGWTSAPPAPAPVNLDLARQVVRGPASALLACGVLNLVLCALTLISVASDFIPDGKRLNISVGSSHQLLTAVLLASGVIMIWAAPRMKRLESHGLAQIASILAMIPCVSPCCAVSLPIGLWAFLTLRQAPVRAAFEFVASQVPPGQPVPPGERP